MISTETYEFLDNLKHFYPNSEIREVDKGGQLAWELYIAGKAVCYAGGHEYHVNAWLCGFMYAKIKDKMSIKNTLNQL